MTCIIQCCLPAAMTLSHFDLNFVCSFFRKKCDHEMFLERTLTATRVVEYVRLEVELGYRILSILVIYEYERRSTIPKRV